MPFLWRVVSPDFAASSIARLLDLRQSGWLGGHGSVDPDGVALLASFLGLRDVNGVAALVCSHMKWRDLASICGRDRRHRK